jgi:signal transduction histidine kinase
VETPLVGGNGQISGVLCQSMPPSDVRGALISRGRGEAWAIEHVAQLVIHDINNLLAVIGSGLRLLEGQSDSADRKVIVGKMQQAIARGALLSWEFLEAAWACPDFMGWFVAGSSLAALAGMLDQALRPAITVRTEIAPDLWHFNADPEELYFALLNLCRNSADAMPDGGTITVAARNVDPSAGASWGFVEVVVADEGEGMPVQVLSQALTPYFTTKVAGSGIGLGLVQVQRFAEGRGGTIGIESEQGAGTLVRLFLTRVCRAAVPSAAAEAYAPSPDKDGGIFHIVNAAATAPTS